VYDDGYESKWYLRGGGRFLHCFCLRDGVTDEQHRMI
jgi:hypothetical protein